MSQFDRIFISHAHHDQAYVKELVDIIKAVGYKGELICSSYPGHDLPQDVNIYDYLREQLQHKVWVVYILSKNYYQSAACLNEMGATWVLQRHYTTILLPNFEFSSITGALDPRRSAFKISDKQGLNVFKSNLTTSFGLENPNDNIWESARDEAIKKMNTLAEEERKKGTSPSRVELDHVRPKNSKQATVVLRFINDHDYTAEFHTVTLKLYDRLKNSSVHTITLTTKLYHRENKIELNDLTIEETSNYDVYSHDNHTIEWTSGRSY